MKEIVLRIPVRLWSIATILLVGILFLLIPYFLVNFFLLYKIEKFPLGRTENIFGSSFRSDGWIVTLVNEQPDDNWEQKYEVCLDDLGERVYKGSFTVGYSAGENYFDRHGQYLGSWSIDDTGRGDSDGVQPKTVFCKQIPSWFFDFKTKPFISF